MSQKEKLLNLLKILPGYEEYARRTRKTLYYGKNGRIPSIDSPTMPMTSLLVERFNLLCEKGRLDKLDLNRASSICYDTCVTPCSVIISLMYLERLKRKNPDYLESTAPSHVFVVAMMVASKFLYDDGEDDEVYNDDWASSAAMLTTDLNLVEKEFLAAIDWNLYIDMKDFVNALLYFEVEVAKREGIARGHFTYTDLATICEVLPSIWTSLISLVSSAMAVCMAGYAATVVGISLGSIAAYKCHSYLGNEIGLPLRQQQRASDAVLVNSVNSSSYPCRLQETEDLCSHIEADDAFANSLHSEPKKENISISTFPKLRFNALRTLTAALLLTSSASASGHYNTPNSFSRFHSCESFENALPPDDKNQIGTFYNDFSTGIYVSNEYKSPHIDNWLGCNYANDFEKAKLTKGCATKNTTEVIFRQPFDSFTTGNYIIPSRRRHHQWKSEISSLIRNQSFEQSDIFKSPCISSELIDTHWIDGLLLFLQWKSLGGLEDERLAISHSPFAALT